MAQTVVITLTSYGADVGPLFNLYSTNQAGVTTGPFQTGLSLIQLTTGYTATNVPDDCVRIDVASTGVCTSYTSIPITGVPTPTPTPTVAPTPTPTPTPTPNFTDTILYKLSNINQPPRNTTTNARQRGLLQSGVREGLDRRSALGEPRRLDRGHWKSASKSPMPTAA